MQPLPRRRHHIVSIPTSQWLIVWEAILLQTHYKGRYIANGRHLYFFLFNSDHVELTNWGLCIKTE